MTDTQNQALESTAVTLQREREEQILNSLPADDQPLRDHVRKFSHVAMVRMLAKPGEDILKTLDFDRFITLLRTCAALVNNANCLDAVKKQVIYNKDQVMPEVFGLPTSSGLHSAFEALTPEKAHLLHMAVGLAGEAGEMLEAILNHVTGAHLDLENVTEEAGDAAFYLQGLVGAESVDSNMALVLLANKVKLLGKRYKNGYSDQAAQERADKAPGQ